MNKFIVKNSIISWCINAYSVHSGQCVNGHYSFINIYYISQSSVGIVTKLLCKTHRTHTSVPGRSKRLFFMKKHPDRL
jgi:hypothetical protein